MEIVTKDIINLDLKTQDKNDAIRQLGQLLNNAGRLNDLEGYVQNVIERETLTTTGIGFGIAIPHGKTDAVKDISVAVARLHDPIDWASLDGGKVDLIFQLAVPESSKGDEHLRLLSALSRNLIHEDFRNTIRTSQTAQEVIDLISQSLTKALEV
ncbi:MAG: PTS sugar transporter subunit IIA [Lactobacillus sp.]|jgi:fructose-specific phosphotransferase system IIA component|nr:PTS sugar transporter subunit IIA [Lactobacillus sp.]